MKRRMLVAGVLASVIGAGWLYRSSGEVAMPEVRTTSVTRGPIVTTVTATGTTEAVMSVSVGSQVSGTIASLGADFNSVVRKGQVIARLDPSLLQAAVEQARANVTKVNADQQQRVMSLTDKETKLARALKLSEQQLVSASDLGDAKLAVEVAKTDLESIKAQVTQAQASVNQAQLNLSHAVITAPIDGTVIQRNVDVGQTVAASLSSPTLFVIAADLTEMRANLSVDESDISKIAEGQPVTITVSAYPGERFRGRVSQVRLQPVVASNVTTYTTMVDVVNADLKLKPGMTATAQVEVARRDNVLRVPTAALRFAPTAAMFDALAQTPPVDSQIAKAAPARTSTTTTVSDNGTRVILTSARSSERPMADGVRLGVGVARQATTHVWAFDDDQLRAIAIRVGISDGAYTEVVEGASAEAALSEGVAVVTSMTTGVETTAKTAATPTSIFAGTGAGGRGSGSGLR